MIKLGTFVVLVIIFGCAAQQSDDERFASMRRTACLVLSRYHSNTQKELIESTIQALEPEAQQRYINKVYAHAVEICEPQISQSEVQEFFVENNAFDPSHLFYLLDSLNYGEVAKDLTTTKSQDAIIKFIKKFDEEMAIRKQENEAKQEQETPQQEKNEVKFLGISIKDISSEGKFIYAIIFLALVGGALYYGFSQVDQKKEKSSNKRRKASPKKN